MITNIDNLRKGNQGSNVRRLQFLLRILGETNLEIDNVFGDNTLTALKRIQLQFELTANGTVNKEWIDFLLPKPPSRLLQNLEPITHKVGVDIVGGMFPATPTNNIHVNLGFILHAMNKVDLQDRLMILTALSTIRAETEGFMPIDEKISPFNTASGAHPFNLYDNRSNLGNRGHPDGERYKGRGFIQLTGRYNYQF